MLRDLLRKQKRGKEFPPPRRLRTRKQSEESRIQTILENVLREVAALYAETEREEEFVNHLISDGWHRTRNPQILCSHSYSDDWRICLEIRQLRDAWRCPVFAFFKKIRREPVRLPEQVWCNILAEFGL